MTAMSIEQTPLPKRFYKTVDVDYVDDCWTITLDGRTAKTPVGKRLSTIHEALARAIADEWNAQEEHVNPSSMPLTQRLMLVMDRGKQDRDKWADGMRNYLQTDLLCYRAGAPEELVQRQTRVWDAYLAWAKDTLSIKLKTTTGVLAVDQPPESLQALNAQLSEMDEEVLCCLAAATEITGSVVLALALGYRAADAEDIFEVSRLDEQYQAEKWGEDAEAVERESALRAEFMAISHYLELISGSDASPDN